jgi:phage/plasmid primase-like uncharacterized protein
MNTACKEAIKTAARGRWLEIHTTLAGIPAEILDGRHHPCPKCGGTDRFRALDDFSATGAVLCNQCFSSKNGDGIAALQWLLGKPFEEVLVTLADHLGISDGNGRARKGRTKKAASPATLAKGITAVDHKPEIVDVLLKKYGQAKPPISVQGIRQCGGSLVDWCRHRCIRLDGRAPIDSPAITAVVLLRHDGEPFPAVGKIGKRKTHTTRGSINSWLASGDVATAETILDVEGITDMLAVVSTGLPPGWVAVTNTAGAKARGKLPRPWAAGKRIIVAGDADEPGQEGIKRAAAAYQQAGAEQVLLAQLPYEIEADHGRDIRDWLLDGHAVADLPTVAVTAEEAAEWAKKKRESNSGREIIIDTDETRVIDEGIAVLARQGELYQRGACLVQVTEGVEPPRGIARAKDAPRIALARHARIRELLADGADWLRPAGEGEFEQVHPPDWVIKGIDARGQWRGIRRLESVIEVPVLRADGSILQTPGYDEATGLLFRPQIAFLPVADSLGKDDAWRALAALLEVVADMPFANEAHRAAWLAATLTPQARFAFHGPAPLFLVDANVRGCGKSLLTDCTSEITAGREMARMALPRDDEEFRKRITALAIAAEPLVLIDNISGTLGSASLDAALTATSWSDRILGQTAMASGIPLFATWYATGNNVILAADTARRTLHIRLESPEENPEERSGFRHPALLPWIRQGRQRLAVAPVTILAAFCAAGRPDMRLKPWGSFEAWSALVRQAVVWVGMPDPAETRVELSRQSDREAAALRQLLAGWEEIDPSGRGMTVAAVLEELGEHPNGYASLRAALWELCPPKDGRAWNPRAIGMKLHHLRGRVIGGKLLDRRDAREGAIWAVCGRETCGTSTTSGTSPTLRAHGRAHAHEIPRTAGDSPASPVSPADCSHLDVAEEPTRDGYVNRTCRTCGRNLGCRKMEPAAP